MPDWKERFAALGLDFEERVDALKLRLRQRAGSFENLQLIPYRSFGNSERLFLKGRVLKEFTLRASRQSDRLWHNLLATFRRFHTVEIPGVKVVARVGESVGQAITDHEGYFDIALPVQLQERHGLWHNVSFQFGDSREGAANRSKALIPPSDAEFGVISDIDDTVILSHLQKLPRLTYAVFMQNARARVVVPGVAEFYQALHSGNSQQPANPIFYLSSG